MNNQITPDQLKQMGNVFYLITDTDTLKVFAARCEPGLLGDVVIMPVPLLQPITELENTRAELDKLGYVTSEHTLGYGYHLRLYRAVDVEQSPLWLSFMLTQFLKDTLALIIGGGRVQ